MYAYSKKHNIHNFKYFWHGSTNDAWASIIRNSLDLNRSASNGKMLGNGIYLAPSADKSAGYTSFRGTRWAHGTGNSGFLGLYATAYGKPWMVTDTRPHTASEVASMGYNCVHATSANTWLRADEVCFYDNDAVCLAYIVEISS